MTQKPSVICPPGTHARQNEIVCNGNAITNDLMGTIVCDVHANGNVFLGVTVWDVYTNRNV